MGGKCLFGTSILKKFLNESIHENEWNQLALQAPEVYKTTNTLYFGGWGEDGDDTILSATPALWLTNIQ